MIYLDSAATTLQKPPAVARAMYDAVRTMSSPGRGGYKASARAEQVLYECRSLAAKLFDADSPEQVVFTFNATHALNIAIKSVVKPGDSVLISGYEHNAVTRTLNAIEDVRIQVFRGALFDDAALLEDLREKIIQRPSAVICTHVSNVFGYILPMDEIAGLCREYAVSLIVDASQSAGCIPVTMRGWTAAFVAMPGHKGLYGPQGTGLLLCGHETKPVLEGGTGSESRLQHMPDFLPDRLEAGTHNVPGVAGLLEGMRYIGQVGTDTIRRKESRLLTRLIGLLRDNGAIELFVPENAIMSQTGVISLRVANRDCHWIGERLAQKGIAVRSGLHCAPLAHQTAGTMDTGTVRVSFSAMSRPEEADAFARELNRICRMK